MLVNSIPLALYIHLPWCVRKCPYCDFNSHQLKDNLPEEKYITTLIHDLQKDLSLVPDRKIYSIFIGGGTPSLFSPEAIEKLLINIKNMIGFEKTDIEITLEANPGTVEQEKFIGFREAGINRLSIGIQSFQADKLKALGRIHDDSAAVRAVQAAKKAGFTNFNLDLMHGLPNQTLEDAIYDLSSAIGFMPPHISWYQLTLEPNTLFHHKPPTLPDENSLFTIQEQGHQLLKNNHYQHYEVSAYCQENYQSQHNLNYWEFGDYLGIGAGAHSKITNFTTGEIMRLSKIKHPQNYLSAENNYIGESKIINKKELPFEFMLNALRLQKPITWQLFSARTGLLPDAIFQQLECAANKNLLQYNENNFQTTNLGRLFLNNLLTEFMIAS